MARDPIPKRGKPMRYRKDEIGGQQHRNPILSDPPLLTRPIRHCCLPDAELRRRKEAMRMIKREFTERDHQATSKMVAKITEGRRQKMLDRLARRRERQGSSKSSPPSAQ